MTALATKRNVTDRALRYRANATPPPGPRRCCLCGNPKERAEVGHVNGHEEDSTPRNLFWTCRSCNVKAANTMRKAGVGRLTRQYNPAGGAETLGAWMNAIASIKGEGGRMAVPKAVAMIHATPPEDRSMFAREIWGKRRERGTDKPARRANFLGFGSSKQTEATPKRTGNRYQQIAAEYLDRVKRKYPNIHITRKVKPPYWAGENSDGSLYMKIPNPNTAAHLYSVIHECGHILLGHAKNHNMPDNLAEYEAETFAMNGMKEAGIPLPERTARMIQFDMVTTILDDIWEGKQIDSRALRMAGGEAELKKRKRGLSYVAAMTEAKERAEGIPEKDRTYRRR